MDDRCTGCTPVERRGLADRSIDGTCTAGKGERQPVQPADPAKPAQPAKPARFGRARTHGGPGTTWG
jgi:hypothetical protein